MDDQGKGVNFTRAVVDVYEDGVYLGQLTPRIDYYFDSQQNMTIPGNRSTLRDDLYILLVDWQPRFQHGRDIQDLCQPAGQLAMDWQSALLIGSSLQLGPTATLRKSLRARREKRTRPARRIDKKGQKSMVEGLVTFDF